MSKIKKHRKVKLRPLMGYAVFVIIFSVLYAFFYLASVPNNNPLTSVEILNIHSILGMRFFNVVLFALLIYLTYVFAMEITNNGKVALLSALLLLITPLANHAIIAWTHIPTAFFILLAYYSFLKFEKTHKADSIILFSFSLGFVFNLRHADVVFLIPPALYILYNLLKPYEFSKLILLILLTFITILPTLLFNYYSFGDVFTTPYHMRTFALPPHPTFNIANEFDISRTPVIIPNMLFRFDPDSIPVTVGDTDYSFRYFKSALFQSSPFLILSTIGFFLFWQLKKYRMLLTLILMSSLILIFVYASWIFYGGGWTTNMRYLTPLIPFFSFFTAFSFFNLKPRFSKSLKYPFLIFFLSLILLLYFSSLFEAIVSKFILNILSFAASVGLFASSIFAFKNKSIVLNWIFLTIFSISLAFGGIMVYLDNYLLFHGNAKTMFLFNFDKSLFIGVVFIASLAFLLHNVLFKITRYLRLIWYHEGKRNNTNS